MSGPMEQSRSSRFFFYMSCDSILGMFLSPFPREGKCYFSDRPMPELVEPPCCVVVIRVKVIYSKMQCIFECLTETTEPSPQGGGSVHIRGGGVDRVASLKIGYFSFWSFYDPSPTWYVSGSHRYHIVKIIFKIYILIFDHNFAMHHVNVLVRLMSLPE